MPNNDIAELRRQYDERIAQYRQKAISLLNEKLPDIEIDERCLKIDSLSDGKYHISNLEYIKISLMNDSAIRCETELGLFISRSKANDRDYQLVETPSFVTHIEWSMGFASTTFFYKSDGKRKKGKKLIRDIKTSSKGNYIILNGKRYYKDKEATTCNP